MSGSQVAAAVNHCGAHSNMQRTTVYTKNGLDFKKILDIRELGMFQIIEVMVRAFTYDNLVVLVSGTDALSPLTSIHCDHLHQGANTKNYLCCQEHPG